MFYTFNRATKREFDRAFAAGLPVTMVKDPAWARDRETFVTRGFTCETVQDPYADGPSRPGERWFFWVADVATATPVGAVEYFWRDGSDSWRFFCEVCNVMQYAHVRDGLEQNRDAHADAHALEAVSA